MIVSCNLGSAGLSARLAPAVSAAGPLTPGDANSQKVASPGLAARRNSLIQSTLQHTKYIPSSAASMRLRLRNRGVYPFFRDLFSIRGRLLYETATIGEAGRHTAALRKSAWSGSKEPYSGNLSLLA